MMIARLSRIVPLIIVLAVVAGIVYLVATYRYSPSRAKEILIKMFTWLTGILSAFFLLVTLYALLESNEAVLDLSVSFLATTLIGLVVTRICNAVFLKRHPDYRHKPMKTREARFPWSVLQQIFRSGKNKKK